MAGPLAPRPVYQGLLAGQSSGAGRLVGDAFRRWNGSVAGGAFATAEEIRIAQALNSVAVRRRPETKRGALTARGPRVAVPGGRSVSAPAVRTVASA